MAEADRLAAASGVPVEALMGAAGRAVAREVRERFPGARRALVLCGPGNNGGDGYVAAATLAAHLEVALLEATEEPRTPAARGAREAALRAGLAPAPLSAGAVTAWLAAAEPDAAVAVDALLGCGLARPLGGVYAEAAAALNAGAVPVVSVDVPTGVDADRAAPPGEHVRADVTVQLAGAKVASAFHPARASFAGARPGRPSGVVVADIGIPAEVLASVSPTLWLDAETVAPWLPDRAPDAHKYEVGTVAVVAGSRRYLGAAELVCRGAWRAGAGLVTLVSRERHPAAWPETVLVPPADDGSWPPPGSSARASAALVVGPGLDPEETGSPLRGLGALLDWAPGRVVLDATALHPEALAPHLPALRRLAERGAPAVLTPHAGEAARLLEGLGIDADVRGDQLGAGRALSAATAAVVVLKGATTVVASPDGRASVSDAGHPGLASGGTGDVLAGALGALLAAPGGDVFERACAAVHLHGLAGERAARDLGVGLVASDVADAIAEVRAELQP
jgi:NAD(P)H-hydrate epimerase